MFKSYNYSIQGKYKGTGQYASNLLTLPAYPLIIFSIKEYFCDNNNGFTICFKSTAQLRALRRFPFTHLLPKTTHLLAILRSY
jgi:hypothetical protein